MVRISGNFALQEMNDASKNVMHLPNLCVYQFLLYYAQLNRMFYMRSSSPDERFSELDACVR